MLTLNKRLNLFRILVLMQCLIASIVTLLSDHTQSFTSVFLSTGLLAMGGAIFIISLFIRAEKLIELSHNHTIHFGVALLPFISVLTIYLRGATPALISIATPTLICLLLSSIEFLFLLATENSENPVIEKPKSLSLAEKVRIAIAGTAIYLSLAIRTPLSGILDGLPWNTTEEFVLTVFIMPLIVVLNHRFFAKKSVLLATLFILGSRALFSLSLPQTGLEIQAFRNEQDFQTGQWIRSYATLFDQQNTELLRRPYFSPRELPVEWFNSPIDSINTFWIKMHFSGYIHLKDGESFAIFADGMKQGSAQLINQKTKSLTEVVFAVPEEKIRPGPIIAGIYQVQGVVIFSSYNQQKFIPVIVASDGSIISALEENRVWRTENIPGSDWQMKILQLFDAVVIGLIGFIILTSLFNGLTKVTQFRQIQPIDLLIASSSIIFLLGATLLRRKELESFIPVVIASIVVLKFIFLFRGSKRIIYEQEIIFALGIPLLFMFLCLDLGFLREVTVFPKGQDNIEYQSFARNIFVDGDIFLTSHPPRAYKILFPYFVGLFHIFWGQSCAAQLFFNAWFAFLSAIFIFRLFKINSSPERKLFILPASLILILTQPSFSIFYFRFGLIEPMAVFLLLATFSLSRKKNLGAMCFTGAFTVLLRFDYLGLVAASWLLSGPSLKGNLKECWAILLNWLKETWSKLFVFGLSISVPSLAVIFTYFVFVQSYMLNAKDTYQTSIYSIFEGILRIILGGGNDELLHRFLNNPIDMLLITIPLATGSLIGLFSFLRNELFKKVDLRWGILIIALLVVYLVLRPTGYSPRFSTPLLPLALSTIYDFWRNSLYKS